MDAENPKDRLGKEKPPFDAIPPVAILELGQGMNNGKEKYGRMNYRDHKTIASVYYNAAMRHLLSWWDGEDKAEDSGVHHLGHAMACLAIILDAANLGNFEDDRPKNGPFQKRVDELTSGNHPAETDTTVPDFGHPVPVGSDVFRQSHATDGPATSSSGTDEPRYYGEKFVAAARFAKSRSSFAQARETYSAGSQSLRTDFEHIVRRWLVAHGVPGSVVSPMDDVMARLAAEDGPLWRNFVNWLDTFDHSPDTTGEP